MIRMTNQAEKPNDCHDFGQKIEFFFSFSVLGQNDLEKMFGDLLDRKQSVLAYKNMHFR